MKPINMGDDCRDMPPAEMANLLASLTGEAQADYYGIGGAVAALEAQVADFLGKEAAMMFPTGTLGNMLVLRRLMGSLPARLVVHRQSHFFNDAGDNISQLGGFTMLPLEGQGAGYSADQLQTELDRTDSARIATRIGAVAVESPSRRMHGRRFGPDLDNVIALARSANLPLYLDGARMLIECAWSGQTPAEMSAPFDVVYMSLYKYLDAPFGCVIAGPASLFDGLHHDRRRFGGSLYQMWPAAVLAAHALPRQAGTWAEVRKVTEAALAATAAAGLPITRPADGTNVLIAPCDDPFETIKQRAAAERVSIKPSEPGQLSLKANESWIGADPQDIANRIGRLLSTA